jgi:hypothetical protein
MDHPRTSRLGTGLRRRDALWPGASPRTRDQISFVTILVLCLRQKACRVHGSMPTRPGQCWAINRKSPTLRVATPA